MEEKKQSRCLTGKRRKTAMMRAKKSSYRSIFIVECQQGLAQGAMRWDGNRRNHHRPGTDEFYAQRVGD